MPGGGKNNAAKSTQRAAETAISNAGVSSPEEALLQSRTRAYFDWEGRAGRDVRELSGMGQLMRYGDFAKQKAEQARQGIGALNLADSGQGSFAQMAKEFSRQQYGRDYATEIENAVGQRRQEALASAFNLSNMDMNRKQAIMNAAVSRESIHNQPKQSGGFLNSLTSAAGSIIGGMAAGGMFASDERLKEDIEDLPQGLETVDKLRPKQYKMDGREQVGFLAQDVEQIAPEYTGQTPEGVKGIYYHSMVPLLAKGIQELKQELDVLKKSKKA